MIHKTKNKHHKILLIIILIIIAIFWFIFPDKITDIIKKVDYSSMITLVLYLPGFFLLMGFIEVLVPEKKIIEHLGKHSGLKGSFFSFFLGSLIPGPLYVAFPLASLLLKKKVSMFNVSLFIGAWSCLKIGEEIFEFQFLGLKFLLLRILTTIPFVVLISFILNTIHLKPKEVK